MKRINFLGKKLYVLTEDEVHDSNGKIGYFMYAREMNILTQVLTELERILSTCESQKLNMTFAEKCELAYKLGEAEASIEYARSINEM